MDLSDLFFRRLSLSGSTSVDCSSPPELDDIASDIVGSFQAYRDFGGASVRTYARFDTTANGRYHTLAVGAWNGMRRQDVRTVRDEVGRRLADHYPALETSGEGRIIIPLGLSRRRWPR